VAQRLADERRAAVRRVFLLTLGLNAAVALAKAGYGYMSGSLTLGTDSLHSTLDASSNVLALFGLRWSAAPADARHPYGRQKIEIVAALGIGVLIVAGLFEFGAAAVHALIDGHPPPHVGVGGFAIVIATMVVNLFVARYEHAINTKSTEEFVALLHPASRECYQGSKHPEYYKQEFGSWFELRLDSLKEFRKYKPGFDSEFFRLMKYPRAPTHIAEFDSEAMIGSRVGHGWHSIEVIEENGRYALAYRCM